ncbi:MAG: deoxyhypusine synthase [Verrucomicrobia bacterium]|nr:deoxyhypusine synthase [Verrucomicrobiota bacterium]MCF7708953.1 deoxyhypusine synthase [Verrucomicrobiota bacterium]
MNKDNQSCPQYFRNHTPLCPPAIESGMNVPDLIDHTFLAYNAGRLREGAHLLTRKMLPDNGLLGLSVTGALTPAGLGKSSIIPMIKAGLIDWMVTTGANLYHDLHFALDLKLYPGSPFTNDRELRKNQIVRIYDVIFQYQVLLDTDAFIRQVIQAPEFQRIMGSDEFHFLLGKYAMERENQLGLKDASVLAAAHRYGVPVFTSSPGDSSIGMNIAALTLHGSKLLIDSNRDVNQTAAIVYNAKTHGSTSSVFILGGGSPKNFVLQTEPQIQEVMGLPEKGHDFFLQCTDARPDTGGLSGATPAEAVSWGKINPDTLPDCVVVYADTTIALPLLACYCMERVGRRPHKRLFDRRDELLEQISDSYRANNKK